MRKKCLNKLVALVVLITLQSCAWLKKAETPAALVKAAPPVKPESPKPSEPPKPEPVKEKAKPAEAKEPGPKVAPLKEEEKYLVLNFSDADLEVVLQTICELLGMNYMIGSRVHGKITIQTYKKIPREELRTVLNSILEINGLTLVESGRYVKILPSGSAKQYPIETRIGKDDEAIPPEDTMVIQIIPLQYISVGEIDGLIRPFISPHGTTVTHKSTNLLFINDLSSNIKRLMKIINMLDVPTQFEIGTKVFVYYVENGSAETLAKILNDIYAKKKEKPGVTTTPGQPGKPAPPKPGMPTPPTPIPTPPPPPVPVAPTVTTTMEGKEMLQELEEGDMTIVAVKEINALVIKTTPRNFQVITQLLQKLDVLPRQVLIEALIADISLNNDLTYGLEWALTNPRTLNTPAQKNVPFVQTLRFPAPFDPATQLHGGLYTLIDQAKTNAFSLWLTDNKTAANVLASPHILTADNKEATINITTQIPVQSTYYSSSSTQSTTSVEFKDVGIKLSITPSINERGLVTLKIGIEYSTIGATVQVIGAATTGTSFNSRNANTTLIIKDGHPVIIGGLIREDKSDSRSGIPFLMDIPVLGYLFGSNSKTTNRSELVLMITPRVIDTWDKSQAITAEYGGNVRVLTDEMKQSRVLRNIDNIKEEEEKKEAPKEE